MTILTIWSESGGVGKTTTALNLGAALSRRGERVLLVDFDPQPASIADYAGYPEAKTVDTEVTITDVLLDDTESINSVIIEGEYVDLIPAHESLANLESTVRAEQVSAAEFLLRTNLADVEDEYDYILIDPPATLNILVDNALIASGEVLVPMEMTRKGKQSVIGVLETVSALETQLQRAQPDFSLSVRGVLPNQVTDSTLHAGVREELTEYLADTEVSLLPVSIPDYNVLESTWDAQLDIFSYAESEEYSLRAYQESLLESYAELADIIKHGADTARETDTCSETETDSDSEPTVIV